MSARRTLLAISALAGLVAACTDATDVELLEITASGGVVGQLYLDLNRSGMLDAEDQPMIAETVRLAPAGGGTAVRETETGGDGVFVFERVPVGSYRVSVDAELLGDSLQFVQRPESVEVTRDEIADAVLGLSFPQLSIEEVRETAPGRRVFTTGIALNARLSFSEGTVFLKGESAHLRATDVARTPAVAVGDSVRFLGHTVLRGGRPALDDVTPIILVQQAQVPAPVELSTEDAGTADGGELDAALVQIRNATVSDTETIDGNFHFRADDGSGSVEVILRPFLGFTGPPEEGAEVARAVGMLAPYDDGSGNIRWRLLVRAESELVLAP